jgi:hypothetical protein
MSSIKLFANWGCGPALGVAAHLLPKRNPNWPDETELKTVHSGNSLFLNLLKIKIHQNQLTNLLYFCRIRLFASSGPDFQEGIPDLPVRRIELALRQLNAEAEA